MSTYTGHWINWSHGAVLGSTITLSARDGGLLTAFLALFVSAAGAAFWSILSFSLHQLFSKNEPQVGVHQQRQVILRNTSSPTSAAWELLQIAWAWRKTSEKALLRSLPIAILALLTTALFGLAGVFSSEVTRAPGNETLIISTSCGTFIGGGSMSVGEISQSQIHIINQTKAALSYARDCYGVTRNVLNCNQYVQERIAWKVKQNASCPFSAGTCLGGSKAAYEMDTGLIDSLKGLGINTPGSQTLGHRKVTTCAPINTRDYITVANFTAPGSVLNGDTMEYLNFGSVLGMTNYTYMYNTHSAYLGLGYTLNSFHAVVGNPDTLWEPVPTLSRSDADVSLFLLAPNSVKYIGPVNDPWFSATTEYPVPRPETGTTTTLYDSDHYINALACTDQYQFCTKHKCTPLTASLVAINASQGLGLNLMQTAIRDRLALYSLSTNTFWSTYGLGSDALRASDTLFMANQGALPDKQWTIEVSSWMATSLARLQALAVQYATGPPTVTDKNLILTPNSTEEKTMCRAQKVRSASGTTSFSVLGVAIILIVGTILISLSLLLSTIVCELRRSFHYKDHKRMQYLLDEKLQLHRLAYEEAGQGYWENCGNSIPITKEGELLGVPEGVDKDHPRLTRTHNEPHSIVNGSEGDNAHESFLMENKPHRITTEITDIESLGPRS